MQNLIINQKSTVNFSSIAGDCTSVLAWRIQRWWILLSTRSKGSVLRRSFHSVPAHVRAKRTYVDASGFAVYRRRHTLISLHLMSVAPKSLCRCTTALHTHEQDRKRWEDFVWYARTMWKRFNVSSTTTTKNNQDPYQLLSFFPSS